MRKGLSTCTYGDGTSAVILALKLSHIGLPAYLSAVGLFTYTFWMPFHQDLFETSSRSLGKCVDGSHVAH